ncbi:aminodeoxychorismate synthase component I (plasmid) [Tsukamurella tyrosinosolvens]|nr:aminodeoxychorismate synthase component I [Tsukamurella tyrosinosolvens]
MQPVDMLRALRERGHRPAALLGAWGGFRAVIAPSPRLAPGVAPDGAPWLGIVGYPDTTDEPRLVPEILGGDPGPLLLLDGDGRWTCTDPAFPSPTPHPPRGRGPPRGPRPTGRIIAPPCSPARTRSARATSIR